MKTLKKFWGVALVVILLSTMLVGSIPASAANYALADTGLVPTGAAGDNTIAVGYAAGDGFVDAAQTLSGDAIYAIRLLAGANILVKSTDGGVSWAAAAGLGLPATGLWSKVAVAPDDATQVFIVDNAGVATDQVYYSSNGGISFISLGLAAGTEIFSIAVSPINTYRYVLIGGCAGAYDSDLADGTLQQFVLPSVVGAWTAKPALAGTVGVPAIPATYDAFIGVAFSPNFNSDQAFYAVGVGGGTAGVKGYVKNEYYNYNNDVWNPDTLAPTTFYTAAAVGVGAIVATKASFAFDPNFTMGDPAAQIAFIGVNIADAAANAGGVFYFAGTQYTLTVAAGEPQIESVAWDGTNLIAAAAGLPTVYRCANALGAAPVWLTQGLYKAPSTGLGGNVLFNNGVAYCFSWGTGAGIAKSIDFGKTWIGTKYLNTTFATIESTWFSADAATKYMMTKDATNTNLWRQAGGVWERIALFPALIANNYLVRADADNVNSIWIGQTGAKQMFKTTDGGIVWSAKSTNVNIADFAVQDASTIYVGNAGGASVSKTSNAGYTWSNPLIALPALFGGPVFSLTLLADNQLIVGGAAGGVCYSTDGATFTNTANIVVAPAVAGTNVVATATGLATGDTIFAASAGAANGLIAKWVIGTSSALTGWTPGTPLSAGAANPMGIALSNGVLYTLDSVGLNLYRNLDAVTAITVGALTDNYVVTNNYLNSDPNSIVATTEATTTSTVWAVSNAGDTINSFSDYLTSPTTIPTCVAPINGTIIPINSISGNVATWLFKWNSPVVSSVGTAYSYDFNSYMDELGTIGLTAVAAIAGGAAPTISFSSITALLTPAAGPLVMPGVTYYWNVKVSKNLPARSFTTPIQNFAIQQLQAIVPTLASPTNGFSYVHGMVPAFSWNPIAGAGTYKFEVSKDSTFADAAQTIYSTTTAAAGASVPATVKLADNTNYFWRVKTLTPAEGEWSAVFNFSIAAAVVVPPPTSQVTPTLTVVIPPATTTSVVITQAAPPPANEVNPSYIWAIIIIGAVLVIAVIVLIVRTRRSV